MSQHPTSGVTAAKSGWLATPAEHFSAALRAPGMGLDRAHGLRPAIALYEACLGLPALQGACVDARYATGQPQPGAGAVGHVDVMGQTTAIFEGDHSSSALPKIAVTFFERTNNAAVCARARALRSNSRSNSSMRLLSLWVACRLARASSVTSGANCARRASRSFRRPRHKIRLNHNSDNPAEVIASTAAASASRPEISVSFFSTVRRELSFS